MLPTLNRITFPPILVGILDPVTIPPPEALALLPPDEELRLSVTTDIQLDGLYGPTWLFATDHRLIAYSPDSGKPAGIINLPLAEVESFEIQDLYGNGALKVRTRDSSQTIALFSKTLTARFASLPD